MITLKRGTTDRLLELGGGERPIVVPECRGGHDVHMDVRLCQDGQGQQVVDIEWDLSRTPWPLQDGEFDGVVSVFCLEHLPFARVPGFLSECHRVLKPGGTVFLATPNQEAQFRWFLDHRDGWDGKEAFEAVSELIYGSQSYSENHHLSFFTPEILTGLLRDAGFADVLVSPYGERDTDMGTQARKSVPTIFHSGHIVLGTIKSVQLTTITGWEVPITETIEKVERENEVLSRAIVALPPEGESTVLAASLIESAKRADLFDRHYFNGGKRVGGYANEGYRDFPVHWVNLQHVLARRPESVLEIGCSRGYLGKKIQDAGVPWTGMEISKHCWLTRAAEPIIRWDACRTPWPFGDGEFDLILSVAVLEHVPEDRLPDVLREMARVGKRCLHGIDFGARDDFFDKTHCTLRDRPWWLDRFLAYYAGKDAKRAALAEIVDKEELSAGRIGQDVMTGDGKVKLAVGTFTLMSHHGWINIDQHDLEGWAVPQGYKYQRLDLKAGLPYPTGSVDLIHSSHVLEHFSYEDGLSLLREFRRVLKPTGGVRVAVPDAEVLHLLYQRWPVGRGGPDDVSLVELDEISDGAASRPTAVGKLWELLVPGHLAAYDWPTLEMALVDAGFVPRRGRFRFTSLDPVRQILRETNDVLPPITLYGDAVPRLA